ncbi:MAG TPA: porin [Cyanobacteria bacterium UBA11372]|nr:porin [Cyanobacteria bacterium UBA11372]
MERVTNVSELRDVQPTDWAYEALRQLIEKYGCIAGYADGTFRGNRTLNRYEFADGLNTCLQQIEKLIAAGVNNIAREDLEKLSQLSNEFSTELGNIRGRINRLEERTTFLENHQFSTTTKLNGLVWFNLTGATAGRNVRYEAAGELPGLIRVAGRGADGRPIVQRADDPNITFSVLTWLTFNTSFTGKDSLVIQLAAGNGISPANQFASAGLLNTFGSPFFDQTAGTNNGSADVIVREIFYQFPITKGLQMVIGPRINWHRFFDYNPFTFIFTGANSFNSQGTTVYDPIDRGSGAVVLWNINKQFELHVGYLGENNEYLPSEFGFNTASDPKKGLFNGTNVMTTELTYKPSSRANIRLTYSYINLDNNGGVVSGEPIYGVADDGQGGSIEPASAHAFGVNFDWLITPSIGIFGRYGYATTKIDPVNPVPGGNINSQAFQLGLGFPNLGKKGALGTLSFLVPFDVLKGREFLVAGGGNGGTQYEIEATYFYPLTDNIALVPAFFLIGNANNFDDNPTIYVGNLRAQFSF